MKTYQEKISELYHNQEFIDPTSKELPTEIRAILRKVKLEEFMEQSNIDPNLPYHEAVNRECRNGTAYVLYTLLMNGKTSFNHVQVCTGYVGHMEHHWIQLNNQFYLDLTLAQFTDLPIPPIAILPIEETSDIYHTVQTTPWKKWVRNEIAMSI